MFRSANSQTNLFQVLFSKGNVDTESYPMTLEHLYEEPSAREREGRAPRKEEPSAGEREGRAPRKEEPSAGEREGHAPRKEEPRRPAEESSAPRAAG